MRNVFKTEWNFWWFSDIMGGGGGGGRRLKNVMPETGIDSEVL